MTNFFGIPAHSKFKRLDLLRIIASVAIVWHHSKEFFVDPSYRQSAAAATHGLALFVDLFFNISGFIIAMIYIRNVDNIDGIIAFIRRRFARLYPLHLLTLASSIVIAAAIEMAGMQQNTPSSWTPKCITLTAVLAHAVVDCGGLPFNNVSWSVSAEMALYVAFPIFAFLGRLSSVGVFGLAVLALIVAFIVAVTGAPGGTDAYAWTGVYAPLRAVPSFLFGISAYLYRDLVVRVPQPSVVFWSALLGLCVAIYVAAPFPVLLALIYILVIGAIAMDLRSTTGPLDAVSPLGELTYSIYMIHGVVILVVLNGFADKIMNLKGPAMWGMAIICYALIVILSYISYRFFERPARNWLGGRN